MTAQKGKDLLLKIDKNLSGMFATVAGLRTSRVAFNAETVDVTDFESAGRWRELLAGAGVQRVAISGAGVFKDSQSDADMRDLFFSGTSTAWQIILPDFGTIEGVFQITSLEYSGAHDGEMTFELALESAGVLNFTGAA